MLFLDNQLPRALLDAVHSVVVGETGVGFDSRNATYSDGSSNHLENATWKTVASRCVSVLLLDPEMHLLIFSFWRLLSIIASNESMAPSCSRCSYSTSDSFYPSQTILVTCSCQIMLP